MNIQSPNQQSLVVEFDIHGLLAIRLVDPSAEDIAAVKKQVGDFQTPPLLREPDITLRFVKDLSAPHLQYLGFGRKAFTQKAFFVFDGNSHAKVMIPFDRLGNPCEIVCESGLKSVPLLMPILNLTALGKGYAAVHGSAFFHDGVGVVIAGWAECGKTTALLGFVSCGAEFIGDECVLLSGDGQKMYGLESEIELSPSHLDALPHLRVKIERSRRWALEGLRSVCRMQEIVLGKSGRFPLVKKATGRLIETLRRSVTPKLTPQELFGDRVGSLAAKPSKLFLLVSRDDHRVEVESTRPAEMARRIAHLAQYEQMSFMEHYQAFRFAFPNTKNPLIERMPERQRQVLSRALARMETYTVWHPYPVVFSELYKSIQPFCKANDGELPSVGGSCSRAIPRSEDTLCKI